MAQEVSLAGAPARLPPVRQPALMRAAAGFEARFLSQMLAAAKVGEPLQGFGGGGAGEAQFASFLRDAYAEKMVAAGGIGLAEMLFHAVAERSDG
ncbi:rod-binding protein [Roseivivax sp. CAU 1761]